MSPQAESRSNRRRRVLVVLLLPFLMLGVVVVVLRLALVCDQSDPDWGNTVVVVAGQEGQAALEWWRQHPGSKIWIVRKAPARPMQLGVLPEFHQHWLDHFLAQGVPRDGIEIVEPAADHPLAAIARQANGVPTAEVVLLADRLTSRRMRRLLDRSQSGPTPSVRVFPMPLTGITEANGWYKPGGIPLVLKEALRLFPEPSPDLP